LANHKSARKRARQSQRRRARNRQQHSRVRTALKRARTALAQGDAETLPDAVRSAESLLRRAASKGVIPRKRASRQVSRLARAAHQRQA
jgi:small subunit ribosomal protein S20